MTRTRGTALGVLALLCWASYGVLLASNHVTPPFRSLAIVFTASTLALVILRLVRGQGLGSLRGIPPLTLALGVIGLFGSNCLYIVALAWGGAPVAVNIAALSWPVFMVAILALFRISPAGWLDGLGVFIGFTGVALVGIDVGIASFSPPVLLAVGGAFCWAAYSALRTLVPGGPSDITMYFVAVSALLSWTITLLFESGPVPWPEFLRLCVVGAVVVGLANLMWDLGARYGDPMLLAGISFLEPLLSTLLIALFLDVRMGWIETTSLGLLIIAIGCSMLSERRRRRIMLSL